MRRALTAPVVLPSGEAAIVDLRSLRVDVVVRRGAAGARRPHAGAEAERFALLAAHDLKSPLCTLGVLADLLDRRARADLDDQAREWLAHLRAGVQRMGSLVDGVLASCGIGVDEGARVDAPVDLGVVAREVVELLSAEIVRTSGDVAVGPMPVVRGDGRQLGLVLQNLIGNALKFVPAGARPTVLVTAVEEGDRWRVRVDDAGVGVPAQDRERIFELFARGGRGRFDGTGIGLTTASRIVERHGGRLWVEDAPGGAGARFSFTLPAW